MDGSKLSPPPQCDRKQIEQDLKLIEESEKRWVNEQIAAFQEFVEAVVTAKQTMDRKIEAVEIMGKMIEEIYK